MYTRLPPEPQRKEPQVDLFPDPQGDLKPGLANYLDEFLSAIKIFGYCEPKDGEKILEFGAPLT